MTSNKPRVIKDYEKLSDEIHEQIKLVYPDGFSQHLIQFTNKEGKRVSALPFETEEIYYLIRMTVIEAQQLIEDDDDYDDEGSLKEESKEKFEDKYADFDFPPSTHDDDDDVEDKFDDD